MVLSTPQVWTEWTPALLEDAEQTRQLAQELQSPGPWQVEVAGPNPLGTQRWSFTPKSVIGMFPMTCGVLLVIRPKIPIQNVLRMWEVAHLGGCPLLAGQQVASTLEQGGLEWLVSHFLDRVEARLHQGLYRSYQKEDRRQRRLAGRLDLKVHLRSPWRVELPCRTQPFTADLAENRILGWTLHCLAQADFAGPGLRTRIQFLRRGLAGHAQLQPFTIAEVLGRTYNRLNQDYQAMHALCSFFLQHLAPTHAPGAEPMIAFRVEMPSLFEAFLLAWLAKNLPARIKVQPKVPLPMHGGQHMAADGVVYDRHSGRCLAVLDAKYKASAFPDAADVHQVRSYAEFLGCPEALLVYPQVPSKALDSVSPGIHTRSIGFPLDGDLDQGGRALLALLESFV